MLVFHFDAELAATTRRGFRRRPAGRADRRRRSRHRRGFHLRQGPRRQCRRCCASSARDTASPPRRSRRSARRRAPVSSSRIREALQAGDPGTATRLPHPPVRDRGRWSSTATSAAASSASRPPTSASATICAPRYGIYAVRVRLDDGSEHAGVANLGIRPMFEPPRNCSKPISSISTATSTAGRSRSSCSPSSAPEDEVRRPRRADAPRCAKTRRQAAASCWPLTGAASCIRHASPAKPAAQCPTPDKPDYRSHRLPAEDRLSDEGRPAAEGAGDPRALGRRTISTGSSARARAGRERSSSTTARPTPMATSISAMR